MPDMQTPKHMRKERRVKIKRLSLASMLSALSVVFLYLGGLIEVLDLSFSVLASLIVILAVIEIDRRWATLVYLVTAVIAVLFLPQKTAAIFYALFFGYYPILKSVFEGFSRKMSWVLKLLVFHAALALLLGVMTALKWIPILPWYFYPGLTVGLDLVFLLYEYVLTRLIVTYLSVLRKRLPFWKM